MKQEVVMQNPETQIIARTTPDQQCEEWLYILSQIRMKAKKFLEEQKNEARLSRTSIHTVLQ